VTQGSDVVLGLGQKVHDFWSQTVSGMLVKWEIVPVVRLVCRSRWHTAKSVGHAGETRWRVEPQCGQTKPDGQRAWVNATSRWASVP
jgi:hypothetical protein